MFLKKDCNLYYLFDNAHSVSESLQIKNWICRKYRIFLLLWCNLELGSCISCTSEFNKPFVKDFKELKIMEAK